MCNREKSFIPAGNWTWAIQSVTIVTLHCTTEINISTNIKPIEISMGNCHGHQCRHQVWAQSLLRIWFVCAHKTFCQEHLIWITWKPVERQLHSKVLGRITICTRCCTCLEVCSELLWGGGAVMDSPKSTQTCLLLLFICYLLPLFITSTSSACWRTEQWYISCNPDIYIYFNWKQLADLVGC
jgi:hypothetical protein